MSYDFRYIGQVLVKKIHPSIFVNSFNKMLYFVNNTCSFNRPKFHEITALTELFIKNFFFWWSPHFSAFESPNNNPPKKYIRFQLPPIFPPPPPHPTPTPTETSPGKISFNPRQYESNHQKQDLINTNTTSKISHYFLQFRIIKVIKFQLRSACYYEFHALTI